MPLEILLFIFVLAGILGFELLFRVPSRLHTPLMSGSNAISGIVVLAAIVAARNAELGCFWQRWIAGSAIFLAALNVVGGYFVTDRMLRLFSVKKTHK